MIDPSKYGPRVDVLITVYNAAATIESAVASIQAQTIRDIRIVVVDDGSTDGTGAILASVAAADARVEVHRQPNAGIVDAANVGLGLCRAEFVARLDADDLADADRFERQLAYLDANPGCVAVGGDVRHIDVRGNPIGTIRRGVPPESSDARSVPCREPYIVHSVLMARRAPIMAIGGYRHAHYAEDSDLYWRLQEIGRLHNMPEVLGSYRLHEHSISSRSLQNGRIAAVCSQLAGLSAWRRRMGEPDLAFERSSLERFQAMDGIAAMVALAAEPLDPDEAAAFEQMVAAKLIELVGYRPYELTMEDCRFVRRSVERGLGHLAARQRAVVVRQLSGTAARMMHGRLRREALLLLPQRYYHHAIVRFGVRTVRDWVARARGRALVARMN